mgnify:CR=1 FL=1
MDTNEDHDEVASDSPAGEDEVDLEIPGDKENDMSEWWTWGNFARLFIVPLVIVAVAVLVYGLFQFMVRDHRAVNDYIQQIEQGTERSRWRAAFDLAQQVQSQGRAKEFTLTEVRRIIQLFNQSDQPRVRMYLARVLGYIPSSTSREALRDSLEDPDPGVRINSMVALGQMEAGASVDRIADLLEDENSDVRRMAAYVLGSLGDKEAVDELRAALGDTEPDVRWNVAIALARLGNESGRSVLRDILESARDGELSSMDPNVRSNLLVNALKAFEKIGGVEDTALMEELQENDPSPEVRKQALQLFG